MVYEQDKFFKEGLECYKNGRYEEAQKIFNEILTSVDTSTHSSMIVDIYFSLANIFHTKGEIGKAIDAFKKVLELEPNHTDASISLSILYNDIGHYESAKKIFEQTDKRVKAYTREGELLEDGHINKKFSQKHYELAEMYISYQRYDEALFEYNKTISLDPTNLEARIKIAKVYAKKKFFNKAFDELKKLKNEYPKYSEGRVALGILYYGSGKVLEAQNEWERVLSIDPRCEEAKMYLNLSKTATETQV